MMGFRYIRADFVLYLCTFVNLYRNWKFCADIFGGSKIRKMEIPLTIPRRFVIIILFLTLPLYHDSKIKFEIKDGWI